VNSPNPLEEAVVGVVGAGVMGSALIKGMLEAEIVAPSRVRAAVQSEKSRARVADEFDVPVKTAFPDDWIAETDVFLLCVKPPRVASILQRLAQSGRLKPEALVISVAAGVTLAAMAAELPRHAAIRAMPNTPCRIGAGATVIAAGERVGARERAMARRIFNSVGLCIELEERHLDAVTAVSGSGPAYGYLVMEALADGAVKVGLPRDVAFQLVSQSMLGAALMMQQSGRHPAVLKDDVTTPSGCTISALLALEDGGIRSTLARAVEAAAASAAKLV